MSKQQLADIFKSVSDELALATEERDVYEVDYELEKARMMFSAEVGKLGSQPAREAQINILLDQKGMYRKMAELKTSARVLYYKWATLKALIDGKIEKDD